LGLEKTKLLLGVLLMGFDEIVLQQNGSESLPQYLVDCGFAIVLLMQFHYLLLQLLEGWFV